MPNFTAEASLYRTRGAYRTSRSAGFGDPQHSHFVTLAYGPSSHAACDDCLQLCLEIYGICFAGAIFWPPAQFGCLTEHAACTARCEFGPACCPKRCTFELGEGAGCCDADEQCVDIKSPNTRTAGCCPSDQVVCAGQCCQKGATCCAGICCPPGYFCRDGLYCEREFIGTFPTTPPPVLPPSKPILKKLCMALGGEPCGRGCCPPGLECCGVLPDGRPDCMTSCLR
jgi:hypothetical protein